VDKLHIFFPSDPKSERDTMLELTGEIGIRRQPGGFVSFLNYGSSEGGRELGTDCAVFSG
jgi:hypothetical protein